MGTFLIGLLLLSSTAADHPRSEKPQSSYLNFEEGDPGKPGDGVIVRASGPPLHSYHPKPGLRFGEITDGITFVMFPPPGFTGNVAEINGGFDAVASRKSGACKPGFSSGFRQKVFATISVNGVTGVVITIERALLEEVVATTERERHCGFTFDEMTIDQIRFSASGKALVDVDAVAFGFSTKVPGL